MSIITSFSESFCLSMQVDNYGILEEEHLLDERKRLQNQKVYSLNNIEYGSIQSINEKHRLVRKTSCLIAPDDKFYLTSLIAFFTGVIGILPITFFVVANDYWMYKLRDPSRETYDLINKTYLQKMFVSMTSIANGFPCLLSVILTVKYGHLINLRKRFLIALGSISVLFIILSILVNINTDSWQTVFFVISLSCIGMISFFLPFYGMANVTYLSKLPSHYMRLNMYGSAVSGLFNTTLQLISLSSGQSSKDSARIYFTSGTGIVAFTFILIYVMEYSPRIQFYLQEASHQKLKLSHTFQEYWAVSKDIWYILVILAITLGTFNLAHPCVTNLVVSEGYTGTGQNLWYDKYFVVVATYLLYDVFQILGRYLGRPIIKKENAKYFIAFALVRNFIVLPLLWFCNAQPRMHLPVLFPHDYQYMIIMAVQSLWMSAQMSSCFFSVPQIAEEKTELALVTMIAVNYIAITLSSPLSPVYVNIL